MKIGAVIAAEQIVRKRFVLLPIINTHPPQLLCTLYYRKLSLDGAAVTILFKRACHFYKSYHASIYTYGIHSPLHTIQKEQYHMICSKLTYELH